MEQINLTKLYIDILSNTKIVKPSNVELFSIIYDFPNHTAKASEVGKIMGYSKSSQSPINLEIGRLGKRVLKAYPSITSYISDWDGKYWSMFFYGWHEGSNFPWQLRLELIEALEQLNFVQKVFYPEELELDDSVLNEGLKYQTTINAYERNPAARKKCIEYYGLNCVICDFNFKKIYGELGSNYIHVHHLIPLSKISEEYEVDPIEDLRPVCPNCHAMIHVNKTPLTIEILKEIINQK